MLFQSRRLVPSVFFAVILVAGLTRCSSSSSDDPSTDATAEDIQAETVADVVLEDLQPTDLAVGDEAEADQVDVNVEDVAQDVEDPWDSLPTLPEGPFTTTYIAGAAHRDVSPDGPMYMGGFGLCAGKQESCRMSEGIHDPVEVNAVAIGDTVSGEVVIFVSLDSTGMLKYDIDLIHAAAPAAFREAFGVKMDGRHLIIAASHTHAGPDTAGLWAPMLGEEREAEEYITFVRDGILEAAMDAYAEMGDIEITWGMGSAPNNSDDVLADDEDVYVLKGVRPAGDVVFTLTRWAAHPTCWGSENNGLSSDYVGSFRSRMAEEVGGVSVFLNGPIGSVYTADIEGCTDTDPFPEGWQDPDNSDSRKTKFTCVGYNLANEAIQGLENGQPLAETGIKVRYQEVKFHPTNYVLMLAVSMGPVPFEVVDTQDPEAMMHTQFSWVTLGELNYISTPGESFPAFGQGIKDRLAEFGVENVVVLGLTQDWLGYLMTPEQWFGEEPDLSYNKSLSPGETVYDGYMDGLDELLAVEFGD